MARTKRQTHLCTKKINGINFTSHEYRNGKYLITAEGYNGERWCLYETWEKRNDGDTTDRRSSFHSENKRWFQSSFTKIIEVPHIIELFPMPLLLNAPKTIREIEIDYVSERLNAPRTMREIEIGYVPERLDDFNKERWTKLYNNSYKEFISYVYDALSDMLDDEKIDMHKEFYRFFIRLNHCDLGGDEEKTKLINRYLKDFFE